MDERIGVLLEKRKELEAVHPGHDGVEDDQVGPPVLGPGQAVPPVAGLFDDEPFFAQEMGDDVADRRVVVDQQDLGRGPPRGAVVRREELARERGPAERRVGVGQARARKHISAGLGREVLEIE